MEEGSAIAGVQQKLIALLSDESISLYVKGEIIERMDSLYVKSNNGGEAEKKLWQYAEMEHSDLASTALATLARLSYTTEDIDKNRLSELANALIANENMSVNTRVTALEVADWLDKAELDVTMVKILTQKKQPEPLQLAAINMLSRSVNDSSLNKLLELAKSENVTLSQATDEAISAMREQIGREAQAAH